MPEVPARAFLPVATTDDSPQDMIQAARQLTQDDVPIGQPLPFIMGDPAGRLLLPAGVVVHDPDDVRLLFQHGPVLALTQVDTQDTAGTEPPKEPPEGRPRLGATGLSIGTVLQVHEKSAPLRGPLPCRLIGYVEGEALFITQPADAKRTLRPGARDVLMVRGFSGRAVITMMCSVVATGQFPVPYLVLSMPAKVQKMPLRRARRVQVRIGATVRPEGQCPAPTDRVAVLRDICLNGALVQSAAPTFRSGDRIALDFSAYVDGQQEDFALVGRVAGTSSVQEGTTAFPSFGVEFTLTKEQTARLSRLIIERLDEPL
ncbi:Pilus assembly protein PilZ [Ralstonia mannitolilytica]